VPPYLAKTLVPLAQIRGGVENSSVRDLLTLIWSQFKPLLRKEVDMGKLYLTTEDDFFLPPNARVSDCLTENEPIKLLTTQKIDEAAESKSRADSIFFESKRKFKTAQK